MNCSVVVMADNAPKATNGSTTLGAMSSRKSGRANAAKIEHRRAVARRRSQQIRWEQLRQLATEQRRRRRKKIAAVSAVVVVAAGAITAYLMWPEAKPKIELTSPVIARQSPPLSISTSTVGYHVTYTVQVFADTGTIENHLEQLSVRRPFDDHVIFYAGTEVTQSPEFEVVNNLGLSANISSTAAPQVQHELPAGGKTDVRLDVTLDDLVKGGFFVSREQRRVID